MDSKINEPLKIISKTQDYTKTNGFALLRYSKDRFYIIYVYVLNTRKKLKVKSRHLFAYKINMNIEFGKAI